MSIHNSVFARSCKNDRLDKILKSLKLDRRIRTIYFNDEAQMMYGLETDEDVIKRLYYILVDNDNNR
jgi:hypothetical protein